jgi:hypothetical protein
MRTKSVASRVLAGVAIATIAALLAAPSASAATIPDPGDPTNTATVTTNEPEACALQRVGTHWARCDVLSGGGTPPASKPADPGVSTNDWAASKNVPSDGLDCPLRRVGRHLVRCDYLTGHVDAPAFIPELTD